MGGGGAPLMRRALLGTAMALSAIGAAHAQQQPAVRVALVPEFASVAPGAAFRVAVQFRIPEGCHISWINPGQSGLPTTVVWRTPVGVSARGTDWPYPEREETAGVVSHVYRGTAVAVTQFRADSSARGTAVLRAALSWGVCGVTCVPKRDTVEISLPIRPTPGETTAAWRALAPSLDALPDTSTDLVVRAEARGDGIHVTIAGPLLRHLAGSTVTFFPRPGGVAVVVPVRRTGRTLAVTLPARPLRLSAIVSGVLVADGPWLAGSRRRALAIATAIGEER
jgi:DsbC/DsbD-like thiol-disulfide interchange protein